MSCTLVITIDCPPDLPRPGEIADKVGMIWGYGSQEEVTDKMFINTGRIFGCWFFKKKYSSMEQAEKDGRLLFGKIKEFYPSLIRYGSWEIEEGCCGGLNHGR